MRPDDPIDLAGLRGATQLAGPHFTPTWAEPAQAAQLDLRRRLVAASVDGAPLVLGRHPGAPDDAVLLGAWLVWWWRAFGRGEYSELLWTVAAALARAGRPSPFDVARLLASDARSGGAPLAHVLSASDRGGEAPELVLAVEQLARLQLEEPARAGRLPAADAGPLPFVRYDGGGRAPLGRPKQGDMTARHGYGPPVFEQCGYACVYCGLDMGATFENWLQLSVDHVVPRQMAARWAGAETARLVEDVTNLVTCCRACNDFGNRYTVSGGAPATDAAFYDLRDRVFEERKAMILAKREKERTVFAKLPAAGPDRPPTPGEDA